MSATNLHAFCRARKPLWGDHTADNKSQDCCAIIEARVKDTEAREDVCSGTRLVPHYREMPSLLEYLLVAQDSPRIERYRRSGDNLWTLTDATGLAATLDLPSIGCALPLADVYDLATFPQDDTPQT